jgi:hypothetical protein
MSDRVKEKIGEDLYKQLLEKGLKSNEFDLLDGWIPKKRLNEEIEKRKGVEGQIETYKQKDIEVEKLLKDNKDITEKYTALNTTYSKDLSNKDAEIENITKKYKVEKVLMENGAMHSDLLLTKVNLGDLKIDGDNIIGLNDQITALKTNYADLFKSQTANSTTTSATTEKSKQQDNGEVNWEEVLSKL